MMPPQKLKLFHRKNH